MPPLQVQHHFECSLEHFKMSTMWWNSLPKHESLRDLYKDNSNHWKFLGCKLKSKTIIICPKREAMDEWHPEPVILIPSSAALRAIHVSAMQWQRWFDDALIHLCSLWPPMTTPQTCCMWQQFLLQFWVVERSLKFSPTLSQLHAIEAAIGRERIAEGLGGNLLWWMFEGEIGANFC